MLFEFLSWTILQNYQRYFLKKVNSTIK